MKVLYKSLRSALGMFFGITVLAASVSNTFAQTFEVQIGTETGTAGDIPITSCYGFSYTQQIFLASDLTASGLEASAEISALRFYYSSGTTNNSTGWTVYLGNTSKTSFTSTTDWESLANLSTVFSGTVTYPAGGNWMEITFDTPFTWDGTSNLIVAVDENQSGWNCTIQWRKSDLGTNRGIYYRNDSTNPDPASPPTATGRVNYVNNIQLVVAPVNPCSGTPVSTNILSDQGTEVCEASNLVLSVENAQANYFYEGITYQWQQHDGTNWIDIADATENTYEVNEITSSADYQVIVGCSHSGNEVVLSPVSVTVHQAPDVEIDVETSVICPSSSVTLTASGADTYTWSPAAGLNATNTATVDASPASPATYTVTGTDSYGCTATAQTTVTPYTYVSTQSVTDPSELCEPNVPVSITIAEVAEVAGGTWNYRFLGADGTTEVQPWNSTNEYNFIPTEDSVYTFYYQLWNTACTDPTDSAKVSIIVGFGSEGVAVTDYDCNNLGGSISLINPFGQVETMEVYSNDFNAPADLSAFVLTGNASNTDGRLVLTPSATSTNGYASLTIPDFTPGTNNSFTLSFDLTADLPINTWGTGGADGFAYSFGDDATPTANGNGHNGRGTKLRLSFDAAGNSSENNNAEGIYLVYGWTANNAYGPGNAQTLAYSNNTSLWKTKTDVPVVFNIDANGLANLTVDGVTIFENIQLPAAYLSADVSTWKHLFSAQTGGDALRHAIDNINISSGALLYGITQNATETPEDWQLSTNFPGLLPGTYYVWAAKDSAAVCGKQIQTIEIVNTNPIVDFGNDTTICAGETLTLDAGNPGSSYVWSNSNVVEQTLDVTTAGTYSVYVTNANGCFGLGAINVAVDNVPSASGIYRQGTYPNFTFTVLNAEDVASYNWDFGDGTTLANAPATVTHYYTDAAPATVTVTLSNNCGSTEISQVYGDLSIEENQLTELMIFPNPATDKFTISLNGTIDASVTVVSATGAIVLENTTFSNELVISTNQWEKGIYFVTVSNNRETATSKLILR